MSKKIANFCLTVNQSIEAKNKFRRIFSGKENRLAKELDKITHVLYTKNIILPANFPQFSILYGLDITFSQRKVPSWFPDNIYYFEFFIHLFNLMHELLDDAGKMVLEGKLIAGIKDNRHLMSLFMELIIREIYSANKCEVLFNDLDENASETYDLHVSKLGLSYAVEIKTVSVVSGFPIDPDWIGQILEQVVQEYLNVERDGCAFEIKVIFKGDRNTGHAEIKSSIKKLLDRLKKSEGSASDGIFHLKAKKISLKKYYEKEKKFQESFYEAIENGMNLLEQGFSIKNEQPSLVSFYSLEKWKIGKKINDVIKDAVKDQLPKKGMSVLWVSIIGLTYLADDPLFVLNDLVSSNNSIIKELDKRQDGSGPNNGLIGMHLMGDAKTYMTDEKIMILTFINRFLSIEKKNPEMNMYLMSTMNTRASELPLSC